jgi:hypothetical protein
MSATGIYITFLHTFINIYNTERKSEFEAINVNETYRGWVLMQDSVL